MAVIQRSALPKPTVPKETITVNALGGEVVVRGLLLSERLGIQKTIVDIRKTDTNGNVHTVLPVLLALCVLDADGLALFDHDGWQAFGGQHPDQAVELFNTAWRLSGFDGATEAKN